MKAFLSYSSQDGNFVDSVANQLGRARVERDKLCFDSGVDIRGAIREALQESDLFVFFASKRSLASFWARFELSEAEDLLREEILRSAVAFTIDESTRPQDLPPWMQRTIVEAVHQPSLAARIVQFHLNRLRGLDVESPLIGREQLLERFAQDVIPAAEMPSPRLVVAYGLDGVGRRSFLKRALKDTLSLNLGPIFSLSPTDGTDRLHALLLEQMGELDSRAGLSAALRTFQSASPLERAAELAQLLAGAASRNWAPAIVDNGSLLNADGTYTEEALALTEALERYPDKLICLIHGRRPGVPGGLRLEGAVYCRVPPLDLAATRLLLTQLLRRSSVEATTAQIDELATYMDGYPPTIALTVSVAREYGLSSIVANKSWLTDFQIRTFAPLLERLSLEDEEWDILRVLANEESLPIGVLATVRGSTEQEISPRLWKLADLSLILPREDAFELASPVRRAVFAARGWLSDDEFGVIAQHLRSTYWADPSVLPTMHVIEATIHAVSRSRLSDLEEFSDIILPSTLYRAAKEQYNRGGTEAWERARELAQKVLEADAWHKKARILLCKVFVRLNDWQRADRVLEDIRAAGYIEQYYVAGFVLWKRGKLSRAVTEFRAALAANDRGVAVFHGLGTCLFRLGNIDEAKRVIGQGLQGRRPSPLLLDLAAQVAIAVEDYAKAEEYIDQLQRLGERVDYNHRRSMLLSARQEFAAALPYAENACDVPNPRFECLAHRIDVRIELEDFNQAQQELYDLGRRFRTGSDKHDVRVGLESKLLLRQGHWRQAEDHISQLNDKNSPFYWGLRAEVLRQKTADLNVSPGERALAKEERDRISAMSLGRSSWLASAINVEARDEDVD